MERVSIRPIHSEDTDAVLRLLQQLWPQKNIDAEKTVAILKQQMAEPEKYLGLVAEAENSPVGFISISWRLNLYVAGLIARVDELVVDGEQRRQGVGKLLVSRIVEFCREKGIKALYLSSALHRKEAHAFYERVGFKKVSYTFEMHFHENEAEKL